MSFLVEGDNKINTGSIFQLMREKILSGDSDKRDALFGLGTSIYGAAKTAKAYKLESSLYNLNAKELTDNAVYNNSIIDLNLSRQKNQLLLDFNYNREAIRTEVASSGFDVNSQSFLDDEADTYRNVKSVIKQLTSDAGQNRLLNTLEAQAAARQASFKAEAVKDEASAALFSSALQIGEEVSGVFGDGFGGLF